MTPTTTEAGAAAAIIEPTRGVQLQSNEMVLHTGSLSFSSHIWREKEMMIRFLFAFGAKEEEIENRRMKFRERIQAQLGRVEEETECISTISEEREYKEALDTLKEKNKEKVQVIAKLMEVSYKLRGQFL